MGPSRSHLETLKTAVYKSVVLQIIASGVAELKTGESNKEGLQTHRTLHHVPEDNLSSQSNPTECSTTANSGRNKPE
ncbi:hypothetical protein CDAR_489321 [Caerostris darwini]|uniref:Uncharacterized protein n=1 Tax=Caerostris darwini TaxID=1538125 RepID=A0AAV4U045_9ARAC|nr:hypothetical protein CDAR_489321 [Caerostris darwini]